MNPPLAPLLDALGQIVFGKERPIRLAVCCLLARGHLLIEDIPGVGKTTLAHALAHLSGLSYQRVQFTSDLLPADILGAAIYDEKLRAFRFHPGPVFHQVVLADEINRASPKTQSALLEAMEERQVSVEGETHPLPQPFFVIATQNPFHQHGTFPLPESQLDRFLMRISLGYPDPRAERALLRGGSRAQLAAERKPCLTPAQLLDLQAQAEQVHVSEAVLDYVQALLQRSREMAEFSLGLSPRAGLGLLQAARAWAFLDGRDFVLPDDVQAVLEPVAGHRLGDEGGVLRLLEAVAVP
ncbi:MoxR family ATPase [Methylomarinovum caldicuralii]|nr:MoxR family ATPase [Methylomarinovum caldicuralii]